MAEKKWYGSLPSIEVVISPLEKIIQDHSKLNLSKWCESIDNILGAWYNITFLHRILWRVNKLLDDNLDKLNPNVSILLKEYRELFNVILSQPIVTKKTSIRDEFSNVKTEAFNQVVFRGRMNKYISNIYEEKDIETNVQYLIADFTGWLHNDKYFNSMNREKWIRDLGKLIEKLDWNPDHSKNIFKLRVLRYYFTCLQKDEALCPTGEIIYGASTQALTESVLCFLKDDKLIGQARVDLTQIISWNFLWQAPVDGDLYYLYWRFCHAWMNLSAPEIDETEWIEEWDTWDHRNDEKIVNKKEKREKKTVPNKIRTAVGKCESVIRQLVAKLQKNVTSSKLWAKQKKLHAEAQLLPSNAAAQLLPSNKEEPTIHDWLVRLTVMLVVTNTTHSKEYIREKLTSLKIFLDGHFPFNLTPSISTIIFPTIETIEAMDDDEREEILSFTKAIRISEKATKPGGPTVSRKRKIPIDLRLQSFTEALPDIEDEQEQEKAKIKPRTESSSKITVTEPDQKSVVVSKTKIAFLPIPKSRIPRSQKRLVINNRAAVDIHVLEVDNLFFAFQTNASLIDQITDEWKKPENTLLEDQKNLAISISDLAKALVRGIAKVDQSILSTSEKSAIRLRLDGYILSIKSFQKQLSSREESSVPLDKTADFFEKMRWITKSITTRKSSIALAKRVLETANARYMREKNNSKTLENNKKFLESSTLTYCIALEGLVLSYEEKIVLLEKSKEKFNEIAEIRAIIDSLKDTISQIYDKTLATIENQA